MIKSEKKLQELAASLKSNNEELVTGTIRSLRNEEPFEGAIGCLLELYDQTQDTVIQKSIEDFFNDIKDLSVRPEVVAEIRRPWKQNTLSMLAASCWQSGLDYSGFISEIAKTFLSGNYTTAIECMTVIEESVHNCSRESKDAVIKIIEESPLAGLNEKSALTLELISILER